LDLRCLRLDIDIIDENDRMRQLDSLQDGVSRVKFPVKDT